MIDHCIDMDWGEDYNEFFAQKEVRARKEHTCCECHNTIRPGDTYERSSGKSEGEFWTRATCRICAAVRRDFCQSYVFGELWEVMRETYGLDYSEILVDEPEGRWGWRGWDRWEDADKEWAARVKKREEGRRKAGGIEGGVS